MGSITHYVERMAIDHLLDAAFLDVPTAIKVALYTTAPTDAGGGTEVSGGSYARETANSWNAAASRTATNSGETEFTEATASWGSVVAIGFIDDDAGDLLFWDDFSGMSVGSGERFEIADEGFQVSFNSGGMSDYAANGILDRLLKTSLFPRPPDPYVSLYSSNPGDDDSGTELSGNGYARKLFTDWTSAATVSSVTTSENNSEITFATPTGAWSTATHFGIHDASTGGNLLFYGELNASRTFAADDDVCFDAGELTIEVG